MYHIELYPIFSQLIFVFQIGDLCRVCLEVVVSSVVCVPMHLDVSPSQTRRNRELGTALESDGSGEPVVGRVVDGRRIP